MSNSNTFLDSCKQAADAIIKTYEYNAGQGNPNVNSDWENQKSQYDRETVQPLRNQLDEWRRHEPTRQRGDKFKTGCIDDGNVGRRDQKARNKCAEREGYFYNGNWNHCWGRVWVVDHECEQSQDWLNDRWNRWNEELGRRQQRVSEAERGKAQITKPMRTPSNFTCCPNITTVVGSTIDSSSINQINNCISQIEQTLNKPPPNTNNNSTPSNNNSTPSNNNSTPSNDNSTPSNDNSTPSNDNKLKKEVIAAIVIGILLFLCICMILSSLMLSE